MVLTFGCCMGFTKFNEIFVIRNFLLPKKICIPEKKWCWNLFISFFTQKGLILDGVHLDVSPGRVSLCCSLPKFGRIQPHWFSIFFPDSYWNKVVSEGWYANNFTISRAVEGLQFQINLIHGKVTRRWFYRYLVFCHYLHYFFFSCFLIIVFYF